VLISPDKKQYPVSVKSQFGCTNNTQLSMKLAFSILEAVLGLSIRKIDVDWRLDFDYLPSERKRANQGREVETLPRIPV